MVQYTYKVEWFGLVNIRRSMSINADPVEVSEDVIKSFSGKVVRFLGILSDMPFAELNPVGKNDAGQNLYRVYFRRNGKTYMQVMTTQEAYEL